MLKLLSFHLDAVFEGVPWQREAFFLLSWLAEDDQLLKQKDTSLPRSRHEVAIVLADGESILLEQFPLSCNLPLNPRQSQFSTSYFLKSIKHYS